MTEWSRLARGLEHLAIFRNLAADPLIKALQKLLYCADAADATDACLDLAAVLYPEGVNLTAAVFSRVAQDDNFYLRARAAGKTLAPEIEHQAGADLLLLQAAAGISPSAVRERCRFSDPVAQWRTEKLDFAAAYEAQLAEVNKRGCGVFARYSSFTAQADGTLSPVLHPDGQRLSELVGYARERSIVVRNTKALLSGLPANNILLYGDAGTGKSSTVKAVANEFRAEGLRLIQLEKGKLSAIPALLDRLADDPLKFVLFIDDLSFASDDRDFMALKTVLEGSVNARPNNVVVYATSNRRHLVRESTSMRQGDEIHLSDTLEEVSSLSARFGILVTFEKPGRDLYAEQVVALARRSGIELPEDALIRGAEAYAIRAGGRSPRTAVQYVDTLFLDAGIGNK